jgi:hypothetical protein
LTAQATEAILGDRERHNRQMQLAMDQIREQAPNLLIVQRGCDDTGEVLQVGYFLKEGKFAGLACWPGEKRLPGKSMIGKMEPAADNAYIRQLLTRYAATHPAEVVEWKE